jgi:hypothetical protein
MQDKFKLATTVGTAILISHIVVSIYLWFIFAAPAESAVKEISFPVTIIYALGFVQWMIANQKRTKGEKVNAAYVRMVTIISLVMIVGHVALPMLYYPMAMTIDQLNGGFLFLETAFGALFALVFSDLFEKALERAPKA